MTLEKETVYCTFGSTSTSARDNTYVGGIAGFNHGHISNININNLKIVHSAKVRYADGYIGGLIGQNSSGTIENVAINGTIENTSFYNAEIGGLIGYNWMGKINNSYTNININSQDTTYIDIGGLVGCNYKGTISESYSKVTMVAESSFTDSGGLVGSNNGTIDKSYSIGDTTVGATGNEQKNGRISGS